MPVRALPFGFNPKTEAARLAAERHAARLITNIDERTRRSIHNLVVQAAASKVPPRDLAEQIRQYIGLSGPQIGAAQNYRKELEGMGTSPARVERLMETFVARKLRERALTIAQYEDHAFKQGGKLIEAREAMQRPTKAWATKSDDPCVHCIELSLQSPRALGKPFRSAIGKVQHPPLHPHCKCGLRITERKET